MLQVSSSEWVLGDLEAALDRSTAAGFSSIELEARPGYDLAELKDKLEQHQLDVPSLCWAWNEEDELGSPDAGSRDRARVFLEGALLQAHELGARQLVVVPGCHAEPWIDEPRERGIERAAESMAAALRNSPADVSIAIEALSGYESFLMNTLAQADVLRLMVDDPRAKLVADVFHMAGEESSVLDALAAHAEHITLVHLATPERDLPTEGIDGMSDVFTALRDLPAVTSITLEATVHSDVTLAESIAYTRRMIAAPSAGASQGA